MDVFHLRDGVVRDYGNYVRSFLTIREDRIHDLVEKEMQQGFLWPEPLVQLNPSFEPGDPMEHLVDQGELHPECLNIFRQKDEHGTAGPRFRLHRHQVDAIRAARAAENYVLTTGTGSGKSLSYIVPIVDHVLRHGSGKGIRAIIVYPMNALANSQKGELEKFLCRGYPEGQPPVTFARYTGQERDPERKAIIANPPDILLTNYVMLELVLTRPWDSQLIDAAGDLRFLVLDELHTYRGRQGADVAMLVRRLRQACHAEHLLHIGTSATLASGGSWRDQQAEIASMASLLFGTAVKPECVIGETLSRLTPPANNQDSAFVHRLTQSLTAPADTTLMDSDAFLSDPLSSWIESTLGIYEEPETHRMVRRPPRPILGPDGVARELSQLTGVGEENCAEQLSRALLLGYQCRDAQQRPLFAFRLHQFFSKGESVYASPEPETSRYITLQAQHFVPGSNRQRALFPLAFCRECGQEYFSVRRSPTDAGPHVYLPRDASDRLDNDDGHAGYLYISENQPWPGEPAEFMDKLPDAWLEEVNGTLTVRKGYRKYLPHKVEINAAGEENAGNQVAWWLSTPFRFCLHCGVTYGGRQQSDFGKLATLGSEGRSTATTIMTLSTIRKLRADDDLLEKARKLLSFTDNRQDASLQSGHFNDFVEIMLLRSAIWKATDTAGDDGLRDHELNQRVFDALNLPFSLYAADPTVKFSAREDTERALREVLGYFIFRDLRRGWRITSPNLEQCGLLRMDYRSLTDLCADQSEWDAVHPILQQASIHDRERVCRVLLDFMRRELAIRVKYLDPMHQETLRQLSHQWLKPPWSMDENETLERGRVVFPCARVKTNRDTGHFVFLSPRGGFGLFLKRPGTFQAWDLPITLDDVARMIPQLCDVLGVAGLVSRVIDPGAFTDVGGYQVNAAGMIWKHDFGTCGFHDLVRVPRMPEPGPRTNPYFTDFYCSDTGDLKSLEAREHTAQVPSSVREDREERFREANLPILYCSPTMELGVDIAQLNVVNMRNIPPTPANYAQRSGRAGRSGQPAFVYSYCAAGSPHDQYFFKRPENMVAGAVTTPRLDLENEDLIRAHVHAIWLGLSKLSLGSSLREVLDVTGDTPGLALQAHVNRALNDAVTRNRARDVARVSLGHAICEWVGPAGDPDEWLQQVLNELPQSFDRACHRWRGLYMAALNQSKRQARIILDPSRDPRDRDSAKRLRAEAEAQLRLLLETDDSQYSDFYSYRYFASEGFLPGYNFPRLPLSAFLPGRRTQSGVDEFLTRPRFLAISEFGPRSIIYHEGSRYVINKVILPVDDEDMRIKRRATQCKHCGYLHPLGDEPGLDKCEHCGADLPFPMENLFRMQNVATRRRDRINSDEEERFRLGYELKTGVRFARRGGEVSARQASIQTPSGEPLATLVYGHAATLWRMNLGWRRRKDKDQVGYLLDVERGYWSRNQDVDDDPEDPLSPQLERVVPYVEDRRNCIILQPHEELDASAMATLEAALKVAIQMEFQLEDRELATEPLPGPHDRKHILIYEAAEGGAGVLRRLVEDAAAIPAIVRTALTLAHFDPLTGQDLRRAKNAREDCEAACYDCLLSYYNQRDHRLLDRHHLPALLMPWLDAQVHTSPVATPRTDQVRRLLNLCQSHLERQWLNIVHDRGLRLPSHGQHLIEDLAIRPDFEYRENRAAIFVDGPHHDDPGQISKDREQEETLINAGYSIIRFRHNEPWEPLFERYPSLFGTPTAKPTPPPAPTAPEESFDPEDFDPPWRPLLAHIASQPGMQVHPGEDITHHGKVVGLTLAFIQSDAQSLHLIDDAESVADALTQALRDQDQPFLRVRSQDPNLLNTILHALKEA